jgi:hypothetical protein
MLQSSAVQQGDRSGAMQMQRIISLLIAAASLAHADADFMSVRTKLAKDYSGEGHATHKYFRSSFLSCSLLYISLLHMGQTYFPC